MRVIRRLAAPVLVLALTALAVPAEAFTIYCEDFCCNSACSRPCWTYDPVLTTCGAYGMCYGSPECTGFAAKATAALGEITSPMVCSDTASDAAAVTPAPAPPAD